MIEDEPQQEEQVVRVPVSREDRDARALHCPNCGGVHIERIPLPAYLMPLRPFRKVGIFVARYECMDCDRRFLGGRHF